MSVKENKIEGDVIISGDVTTGGGVVANGDSVFNKDVIIKGKLDASNIRGASKGAFPDEATLKEYYPNPKTGWWALVKTGGQGTTFSFATYLAGPHGWYNSGKILENVSIDLTDIQISNDNALAGLQNSINNEATARQKADADLQTQIDRIMNSSGGTSGGASQVSLLPFDGIVSVSNDLVKPTSGPSGAIVFNNTAQRFIAKSGDSYYASWLGIDAYGTSDRYGCIPNPGIYILRSQVGSNKLADAIYKWTGSQMVLVSDFPTKTSELINDSGFITLGDIPGTGGDLNNLASSALPFEFTTGAVVGVNIMPEVYEGSDGKIVHQNGVFYYQVQTPQGTLFYTKHADLSKYGNTASDLCHPENDRLYCDRNGKLYVGKNLQLVPTYATKVSELTDSADYAKRVDIPTNVGQLTNDAGYIKASEIGGDGNINIASSALRFNGFNHDAITVKDEEFEGVGLIIYSSVKSKFVFKGERNGVSAYYSKHKSLDIFGIPTSEGYSPRIGALYYYNQNLFIGIENGLVQLSGASGAGGGNAGSGIKSILPFAGYIDTSSYIINDTAVDENVYGSVYYDKTQNKFFFISIGIGGVFVSTKWNVSTKYGKTEDYGTVGSDGRIEAVEPSKGYYYICDNTIYTVKTYGLEIVAELDNGNSLSFDEITTEANIKPESNTSNQSSGKIVFSSTQGCFLFKEEGLTSGNAKYYIWHERLIPFGYVTSLGCKPYENKLYFCNNRAYRYANRTLIPFGPTKVSELQNDSGFITNADLSSKQAVKIITLDCKPSTLSSYITPKFLQEISSALSEGFTIVFEFKFIAEDFADHRFNGCVIPAIAIKSTTSGGRRFFISYFIHGWYVSVDVSASNNFSSIRVNEDSGYTQRIDLAGNPSQSPSLPDSGPSQSPSQPDVQSVFSRIGYTNEEVNICHDAELDYSEELRAKYENKEISNFSNDNTLVYPPMVNTGDLSDMSRFYYKCSNILTIPALNTSFAMSMVEMLAYCTSLRSIPYIETWNVQDMDSMFYNCSNLESIPQLVTSNVRNMSWMFGSCTSLKTIPMIDCHSVRNTSNMFNNCQALVTVPSLNTKSADNMKKMFADCAKLEKVEGLEFGNVTDMSMMFTGCTNLKYLLIYDLGKSQLEFYNFADVVAWGTGGESNRDSLIESLVEHSFDRASAGMTTATIRLSADSRALLTNDNISRIASKGYEVVVY